MLNTFFQLILFIQFNTGIDYQKIFGDDYTNALNYLKKNKLEIQSQLNKQAVDKEMIIPVIFPERIRYSIVSDLIETAAVELVYIEYGSDYVDFSIGDFQIKPSFAEMVEMEIVKSADLREKYRNLISYSKTALSDIRKERVQKLKSLEYQMIYIAAFYDMVMLKFNLNEKSKTGKIEFLAAAYNHGFADGESEIEKCIGNKFFPFGAKYGGKQFAYTDIAVDFYLNHYQSVFK